VPTEPLYVALGDSTAVGVGAEPGGGYPIGWSASCARVPGASSSDLETLQLRRRHHADVLGSQVPRALRTRPRLITLGSGIGARPELFSPDGFPPSALGYDCGQSACWLCRRPAAGKHRRFRLKPPLKWSLLLRKAWRGQQEEMAMRLLKNWFRLR